MRERHAVNGIAGFFTSPTVPGVSGVTANNTSTASMALTTR